MPYKHIKLKIKRSDDKRIKLTEKQRNEIRELYGTISQRKLAKRFGVSRRLICFIGDESQLRRNLECRELRGGWKQYYNKDKWKEEMKKHRHHKQKLFLEGKLFQNKK